jgi:hypothetical protein
MPPPKRKPRSGKPASRRSPRKPPKTAKPSSQKPQKKVTKRVAAVRPLPAQPEEILFRAEGKMSTFGGPHDLGMSPDEGVALFSNADLKDPKYSYLFLPVPPPGTSGLGRRLNPDQYYFACRWNYNETPKEFLRRALARVENPAIGRAVDARPVDWGPNASTGRVADLSPGLAAALGLDTDDIVRITISARRAIPVKPSLRMSRAGHGSSNPHAKPVIKLFIKSPNCSCRNGLSIDKIVFTALKDRLRAPWRSFKNLTAARFQRITSSIEMATSTRWSATAIVRIIAWAQTKIPWVSNMLAVKRITYCAASSRFRSAHSLVT